MKYDRIEVRLDPEHARKVSELREKYGTSTSEIVRRAIDEQYEEMIRERRKAALEYILGFQGGEENVPDVETIKRQSGRSNDPDLLDPY